MEDTMRKLEGKKLDLYEDTDTKIMYLDTVGCGIKLIKEGYNPVILNMAGDKRPTEGTSSGLVAQEESLCIQGGLYDALMIFEREYPWAAHGIEGFYHPNVPFIRDIDYAFLDVPRYMSVISMPFLHNKIKSGTNTARGTDVYNVIYSKIDVLLATAYLHGHDSVVLGAWGCGEFGNDPTKVSQIFKDVIEDKYSKTFKRILFGIIDTERSDNYTIFKKTFAPKTVYKAPIRGEAWKPDAIKEEISTTSYSFIAKKSGITVGIKGASVRKEDPVFATREAFTVVSIEEQERIEAAQKAEKRARKKSKKSKKSKSDSLPSDKASFDFLG